VFIDGRPDMYGDAFVNEYQKVARLATGWESILDQHAVDIVIMDEDAALTRRLDLSGSGWKRVFTGPEEVVFARDASMTP
jgi:hypothetical protein